MQLSDEVKLLLDKIFKVNEKERITIEGIKEDPWYSAPLAAQICRCRGEYFQAAAEGRGAVHAEGRSTL